MSRVKVTVQEPETGWTLGKNLVVGTWFTGKIGSARGLFVRTRSRVVGIQTQTATAEIPVIEFTLDESIYDCKLMDVHIQAAPNKD